MNEHQERRTNHAAYRQLKDSLTQTSGAGRFIAIANGQVLANADSFAQLRDRKTAQPPFGSYSPFARRTGMR